MRKTIAAAALSAVVFGAASANSSSICGDVNNSGTITTSDALAVLRTAVGQSVGLVCAVLGQLPKTGQTSCYDVAGAPVACGGTGQDGEFRKGAARSFTDNGNGTVSDNLTGLMWEKNDDSNTGGSAGIHDKDNTYLWANAFGKISDLNGAAFAGHSDWRLPNRAELESLVSLEAVSPATYSEFHSGCAAGCTVLNCSCTRSDFYWTSSTYKKDPTGAWIVYFVDGYVDFNFKPTAYAVRAVRGGS
jgi:hypothetical protein